MSLLRRMILMNQGSSTPPEPVLPYDAEVEYLEASGTQYIDLNVYATTSLVTEIEFTLVNGFSFSNTAFLFGTYDDGCIYSVAMPSLSNIRVPSSSGFTNLSVSLNYTSSHTISFKPGAIYFDGVIKGTQSRSITTTGVPVRLWGRNATSDSNKTITSKVRIHGVKLSNSSGLILELIPVRLGQIGYLYDRIGGNLYGNNGTGNFILGSDIV